MLMTVVACSRTYEVPHALKVGAFEDDGAVEFAVDLIRDVISLSPGGNRGSRESLSRV